MGRNETFESDGFEIEYDDIRPESGEGRPIVLVHGFASNRHNNWEATGWYDRLTAAGRRVIALDNRGHGESAKPHDPGVYGIQTMAGDVVSLLDHLGVDVADYFGYSMGGRIGVEVVRSAPERVNAAVLGGIGSNTLDGNMVEGGGLADALVADDVDAIENEEARTFRVFAEETGADREALAAVMRAHQRGPPDRDLTDISQPILLAAGSEDELVQDLEPLAASFGNAESVVIPGEDHLSTVFDEAFVEVVSEFFDDVGLSAGEA